MRRYLQIEAAKERAASLHRAKIKKRHKWSPRTLQAAEWPPDMKAELAACRDEGDELAWRHKWAGHISGEVKKVELPRGPKMG